LSELGAQASSPAKYWSLTVMGYTAGEDACGPSIRPAVAAVISNMRIIIATIVVFLISSASFAQERPHTLTGDIRVHKNFHSKILTNDRDVLVYLPPSYEAQKKERYPVFYLNDGQNLFDGGTSFIPEQEWRVDETAEALIKSGQVRPLKSGTKLSQKTNRSIN